jgi:hypothetical protein
MRAANEAKSKSGGGERGHVVVFFVIFFGFLRNPKIEMTDLYIPQDR